MSDEVPQTSADQGPCWQPLSAIDRRVMGVLVEKSKTTPDQYPMSTSALRSGANQKNNRYPLMELELEDVEESLARLRAAGAVTEVQSSGRVARFRHQLYQWLGVDKVELAVMGELLLRGAQTEGELRGRAARMEPIADLAALRPIVASLKAKGLVIPLTPEGRGHVLTHALYQPRELEKVRAEAHSGELSRAEVAEHETDAPRRSEAPRANEATGQAVEELRQQLAEVRAEVAQLRSQLEALSR